jgi:flagellar protein FlaI
MNIPPMLISMMNVVVLIRRIKIGNLIIRKVLEVSEIVGIDTNNRAIIKKIYEWDPQNNIFALKIKSIKESYAFEKITDLKQVSIETLNDEMKKRESILEWMAIKNINNYDEVANIIRRYYQNPDEVYKKARLEVKK